MKIKKSTIVIGLFLLCLLVKGLRVVYDDHIKGTPETEEQEVQTVAENLQESNTVNLPEPNYDYDSSNYIASAPSDDTFDEPAYATRNDTLPNIDPRNGNIIVTFIDVGQGNCALIQDNGTNILIDTGKFTYYDNLEEIFSIYGINQIDTLILSHADKEHVQSASEITSYYGVKTIYMTDNNIDSDEYGTLQAAIEKNNVTVVYPHAGDYLPIPSTAMYYFVGPTSGCKYDKADSYSLILRMINLNDSILFTGDATNEELNDSIKNGFWVQSNVMVAPSHGSSHKDYNDLEIWKTINPSTAVITCGYNNDFDHPGAELMNYLQKNEIDVYRTDLQGTISCVSTGKGIIWTVRPSNDYRDGKNIK